MSSALSDAGAGFVAQYSDDTTLTLLLLPLLMLLQLPRSAFKLVMG